MRIRDYMTSTVMTLQEDARLLDAALLIRRTGKRHVPIVDDQGRPVGIISDRDIARYSPSVLGTKSPDDYNSVFESTPITTVMTKDPVTLTPEDPISAAVQIMYTQKIGAVLAVENGKIAGILTVNDMLGLLNELLSEKASGAASF